MIINENVAGLQKKREKKLVTRVTFCMITIV